MVADTLRDFLENGNVRLPKGYKEARELFVANGWTRMAADPRWGFALYGPDESPSLLADAWRRFRAGCESPHLQ